MYIMDQTTANEIAQKTHMKYPEMRRIFQATEEEADKWEMESRKIVEEQSDSEVARAVVIYCPLYLESQAITEYCQKHPEMRNQLPEILTVEEMALIAQMDIRLDEQQMEQVIRITLNYQRRLSSEQKEMILLLSIEEALKEEALEEQNQAKQAPENQQEQPSQQTESKPYQEIQEPSQKISSKQPTTEEIPQKESPSNSNNDLSNDTLRIVDNTAEKQARVIIAGAKMMAAHIELGHYKFSDLVNQFSLKGTQITDSLLSAIKSAYVSFAVNSDIEELDDMKTVRAFKLSDITDAVEPVNQTEAVPEVKEKPKSTRNTDKKNASLVEDLFTQKPEEDEPKKLTEHEQEVKRRVLAWEEEHGKKLKDLSEAEWIEATQQIMALTELEAEEYLSYLQAFSQNM